MAFEGFEHIALWTKPDAPFLSMECWTGYADTEGFAGNLQERPSMRLLEPGGRGEHVVSLTWKDG